MDTIKNNHTRSSAQFMNVICSLEKDLQRLRNKDEISKNYIAEKDSQIDQLVKFYNDTDEIINHYELQIKLLNLQNKILADIIDIKVSRDDEFSDYFLKIFLK